MSLTDLDDAALHRLAISDHHYTQEVRDEFCRRHLIAEALFASNLQPSEVAGDLDDATVRAILTAHDCQWCAAWMAKEFGDHPDQAAARMRWALAAEQRLAQNRHALAGGGA